MFLTVAVALLVVLLVGGGGTSLLLYHRASARADRANRRATASATQVASLRTQLATESQYAQAQFTAGMKASGLISNDIGLTFADGYKSAFAGFNSWTDGSWYLVKISQGQYGHEITSRTEVTPCQQMYVSHDQTYINGRAC